MMLIDVVAMLLKVNCVDFWPLDKLWRGYYFKSILWNSEFKL